MRLDYPANIKIIRLPCTGKIDVIHLLRAIQKGADGVYVVGCLEGTCHYNEGNFRARERVEHVRMLLEEIGLEAIPEMIKHPRENPYIFYDEYFEEDDEEESEEG